MTSHPTNAPDISGLRIITYRAPGAPGLGYELAFSDSQEEAIRDAAKARGLLVAPGMKVPPSPDVNGVMDYIRAHHAQARKGRA